MALPILNASSLNNGTEKEREEFGKALLSALTRDGAVKVVNTRITDGEVAQAFDTVRRSKFSDHCPELLANIQRSARRFSICLYNKR